ncbi:hypothetical protein SPRG_02616 [Saprolegnia parasitica CBS 223.65]|uniref:Uncharacterized protein n=1 Tax=Saprolegnia parasitica (strain CBS 223.65) TaxID=695850 RepID=A0A067CQX6_SAPPC|nr:hypothetical protein SPRG_02616 [Saprolegnia parasitica CBS 223.65]KDO32923.1 hypothetical protein SPRG_02616 [Saprolegnia parasitica CBS 223.65]|eukprot:XP_012196570.1 hypothetical protein SPRG_02616 [Saprolegnia parasitica CBS 223.65]
MEAMFEAALADVPATQVVGILCASLLAVATTLTWLLVLRPHDPTIPPCVVTHTLSDAMDLDTLQHRCSLREIDREIDAVRKAASVRRLDATDPLPATDLAGDGACEVKTILEIVRRDGPNASALRRPLTTIDELLRYFKAPDTRDVSKTSVVCKVLLKHDALGVLRDLAATTSDHEIQALAQRIVESAVASIWS